MSTEAFLGEVELYGFNYAPRGFVFCYGQIETIQSNTALFSLLSSFYGGDGRSTFGIPDLRGRVAVGDGNGPGLTPRPLGDCYGAEIHRLSLGELPPHNHAAVATAKTEGVITGHAQVSAFNGIGDTNDAENAYWATGGIPSGFNVDPIQKAYSTTANTTMASGAVQVDFDASDFPAPDVTTDNTGSGQYFFINQPSLVLTYAISTDGIYPPRS